MSSYLYRLVSKLVSLTSVHSQDVNDKLSLISSEYVNNAPIHNQAVNHTLSNVNEDRLYGAAMRVMTVN